LQSYTKVIKKASSPLKRKTARATTTVKFPDLNWFQIHGYPFWCSHAFSNILVCFAALLIFYSTCKAAIDEPACSDILGSLVGKRVMVLCLLL